MQSVLITNLEGRILLSRYFDSHTSSADYAAGFEVPQRQMSSMRDKAQAMRTSESEVLGQTRHLWMKGTAERPQVARAKV